MPILGKNESEESCLDAMAKALLEAKSQHEEKFTRQTEQL